jgi:hypothetical protein
VAGRKETSNACSVVLILMFLWESISVRINPESRYMWIREGDIIEYQVHAEERYGINLSEVVNEKIL